MAQLSDDCFAGPQTLTFLEDALRFLEERLQPMKKKEVVPLTECLGRILAEDLIAPFSVPPHANSAVDGYLVYFDDLRTNEETRLRLQGNAKAGHPFAGIQPRGTALRVLTGAMLPEGPDTILMQEDCRREGDDLFLKPGIKRGANLRKAGEDIKAGTVIQRRGQRLRPQDLAQLASIGRVSLPVYQKLRLAIFSTGDEIKEPGEELLKGQIYDSNRMLVQSFCQQWGVAVNDLGILPDEPRIIKEALREASRDADMLLTTGGVSTGDEDHVKKVVEELGQLHFWRLAIKPGRPLALGQINGPDHPIFFTGLPGNPVAAFVNLIHVVRPILFQLMGADKASYELPRFTAIADFHWKKKPGRREWLRVSLHGNAKNGLPRLMLFPREGAGILSSLTQSDGLAEIPEAALTIQPGDEIDYLPFLGMW